MTPTWENVAPLVLRTTREGRTVAVVLRCPDTGERIASRAIMAADGAPGQVVSSVGWQVRSALANEVSRMLGGGVLGQIGRRTVDGAMRPATTGSRERVFDEQDERDAIVRAFIEVQPHFRWSGSGWVSARAADPPPIAATPPAPAAGGAPRGVPSPAPPPNPSAQASGDPLAAVDPRLVARLLMRVAHADGALDASEEALLATLGGDPADAEPLSGAELDGVPTAAREPLWRLAATVAVADGEFGGAEQRALQEIADRWQIGLARRSSLDREAREHVVRLALRAGVPSAASFALRLGVPAARLGALKGG